MSFIAGTCASALQSKEKKGRPLVGPLEPVTRNMQLSLKPHSHLQARGLDFSRPLRARVELYYYHARKGEIFDSFGCY